MPDPYLLPNGTLRNKLDLADAAEFARREDQITAVRQAVLDKHGISSPFDFNRLKGIHRYVFQDVYEWAGKSRVCNLSKAVFTDATQAPSEFVPFTQIAVEAERIFGALAKHDELRGLERLGFVDAVADLFVEINNLHAFREGNGRTQRIFLKALASSAGHELAFDVVTRERMIAVSVAGINGDRDAAKRLFMEISDPDRVGALRKALKFLKATRAVPWNDLYIATTVAGREYFGVLVGVSENDFMMRVSENPQDWLAVGAVNDLPEGAASGDEVTVQTKAF